MKIKRYSIIIQHCSNHKNFLSNPPNYSLWNTSHYTPLSRNFKQGYILTIKETGKISTSSY